MNWGTVVSLVICLAILTLRFMLMPGRQRSTPRQRIKLARILIGGLLALAAIGYVLKRDIHNLDGKTESEPSLMERVVMKLNRR